MQRQKLSKNYKIGIFPKKKHQEEITARDLLKTDISKISEQEFRTTVIRLLAGLEKNKNKNKNREDTTQTLAAEVKDLKTSQVEIQHDITKMQNQLHTVTTRIEEAEE